MRSAGDLGEPAALPVSDLMEFLYDEGLSEVPGPLPAVRVAYHDACHALRAQHIHDQPRTLLRAIPGVELVEIPNGDRCCGAAGLYNVTEPQMAGRLMREKAEGVAATGAQIVAVTDDEIIAAWLELAQEEGLFCEPSSAAGSGILSRIRP
jgi:glycolate oxidase iron-sulfur subunit